MDVLNRNSHPHWGFAVILPPEKFCSDKAWEGVVGSAVSLGLSYFVTWASVGGGGSNLLWRGFHQSPAGYGTVCDDDVTTNPIHN